MPPAHEHGDKALSQYLGMKMIAIALKESHNVDWNDWAACLNEGNAATADAALKA